MGIRFPQTCNKFFPQSPSRRHILSGVDSEHSITLVVSVILNESLEFKSIVFSLIKGTQWKLNSIVIVIDSS